MNIFTDLTVDGFALWIVLLVCCGVFLASFMDCLLYTSPSPRD